MADDEMDSGILIAAGDGLHSLAVPVSGAISVERSDPMSSADQGDNLMPNVDGAGQGDNLMPNVDGGVDLMPSVLTEIQTSSEQRAKDSYVSGERFLFVPVSYTHLTLPTKRIV